MFNTTRDLIQILGIDVARLRLEWVSSAEGTRFAEIVREFTKQIEDLGPSALTRAA